MTRIIPAICLGVSLILQAIDYALCYRGGWSCTDDGSFGFLLVGGPILLAIFLFLLMAWFVSLWRKRDRLWTTGIFLAFFASFWIENRLLGAPGYMAANGLRDQIMRDYRLDDLRSFAREAQTRLPVPCINHGDISELSPDAKRAYQEMTQRYPFMRWGSVGSTLRGASIMNRATGTIEFEWGSALSGHWGCSISVNGLRNDPGFEPQSRILRVSEDIIFFSTAD